MAVALVSIGAFAFAVWRFRLFSVVWEVFALTQSAVGLLRNAEVTEEQREAMIRQLAVQLLAKGGSSLLRTIGVLMIALIPIYAADSLGVSDRDAVLGVMFRWDFIAGASVAILLLSVVILRLWTRN